MKSSQAISHVNMELISNVSETLCLRYQGPTVITMWRLHVTSAAFTMLFAMQHSVVATPSAWVPCLSLETSSATDMDAALSASSSGMPSADSS
jgi:hypothetical protein